MSTVNEIPSQCHRLNQPASQQKNHILNHVSTATPPNRTTPSHATTRSLHYSHTRSWSRRRNNCAVQQSFTATPTTSTTTSSSTSTHYRSSHDWNNNERTWIKMIASARSDQGTIPAAVILMRNTTKIGVSSRWACRIRRIRSGRQRKS